MRRSGPEPSAKSDVADVDPFSPASGNALQIRTNPKKAGGDTGEILEAVSSLDEQSSEISVLEPGQDTEGDIVEEEKGETSEKVPGPTLCTRFKGILLALSSSLCLALSIFLASILVRKHGQTALVLNFVRFIVFTFVCVFLLIFYRLWRQENVFQDNAWPLSDRKVLCTYGQLVIRCLTGIVGVTFNYLAIGYISLGEVSTIIWSNPLVVSVGARILLGEKMTIFHTCSAFLALIGVVFIAEPPFIFGHSSAHGPDYWLGIGFALISMVGKSAVTISLRTLRHVHFVYVNLSNALLGVLISLIIVAVAQELRSPTFPVEVYFIFIAVASLSLLNQVLQTLALHFEKAGIIAVVRSTDVIFSYSFQLLNEKPIKTYDFVGTGLVLLCIALIGLQKYVDGLPPESKLRKKLWFTLK